MRPSSRVGTWGLEDSTPLGLLLPGEFEVLFLHRLLTLQKTPRKEANGTCSPYKREPRLGLTASYLEEAALPLRQKALLPLPPAENPACAVIKTLTRGFHSNLKRNHRAPTGVRRQEIARRQAIWCGWGSQLHILPKRLQKKTYLSYSNKLCLAGLLFLPCGLGRLW